MNKISIFPYAEDLYDRYQSLRDSDPYRGKREDLIANFNRNPWLRPNNRKDPNFGQFKFKVETAINVFIGVATERKSWFRVVPKYLPAKREKFVSEKVTSSFYRHFIRNWPRRGRDEALAAYDMVMFGKAIEHWPSRGCVYTENVPEERVFPNSSAGMDPKTWDYVFVEIDYTVARLKHIYDNPTELEIDKWDREYLGVILNNPELYSESHDGSQVDSYYKGEVKDSNADTVIRLVFAYVKEDFSSENPVSKYVFPACMKEYRDGNWKRREDSKLKYLIEDHNYAPCISSCVHVRHFQTTRSYYKFNSFAQQQYLATALYDRSISLAVRTAQKNSVLYLQTENQEQVNKLKKFPDEEIQILSPDTKLLQTRTQSDIRDIVEITRQVTIDTDNAQAIAQSPGSQNVKGYAITAQEATIRAQQESEAQANAIKMFIENDVPLYEEVYRRAMMNIDVDLKKAYKAFVAEMEEYGIEKSEYEPENVFFVPVYTSAASRYARILNSQGVLEAVRFKPTNEVEESAQTELIASYVGYHNLEYYSRDIPKMDPAVAKAGGENEDLDSPYVNPQNIPVLPEDMHMIEIPVHIQDYEAKLNIGSGIVKTAMSTPNRINRIMLLQEAQKLIAAQDNKGAHIIAHMNFAGNSKENMETLRPWQDKLSALQSTQDKLSNEINRIVQQSNAELEQFGLDSEKERHARAMNQLAEEHKRIEGELKLAQNVQKAQLIQEQRQKKAEFEENKQALSLAVDEEKAKIEIEKAQSKAEQKIFQKGTTTPPNDN